MTDQEALDYVASLPLVQALWWFIENAETTTSEMFFQLRERVRANTQPNG